MDYKETKWYLILPSQRLKRLNTCIFLRICILCLCQICSVVSTPPRAFVCSYIGIWNSMCACICISISISASLCICEYLYIIHFSAALYLSVRRSFSLILSVLFLHPYMNMSLHRDLPLCLHAPASQICISFLFPIKKCSYNDNCLLLNTNLKHFSCLCLIMHPCQHLFLFLSVPFSVFVVCVCACHCISVLLRSSE